MTLAGRPYATGLRRRTARNWRAKCALVVAIAAAAVTGAATTATAANKGEGVGVTGVAANRHRGTTTTTVPPTTTTTTSPRPTTTTSTTTTSTTTTTVLPVGAPSDPQVQLVPLYEYAGSSTLASDWAAACANDAVVVAAGASSGPPTSSDADWTLEEGDLLPAMESCYPHSSVKGEAIGYVNTGYGSIPVSTVDEEMKQWVSFDPTTRRVLLRRGQRFVLGSQRKLLRRDYQRGTQRRADRGGLELGHRLRDDLVAVRTRSEFRELAGPTTSWFSKVPRRAWGNGCRQAGSRAPGRVDKSPCRTATAWRQSSMTPRALL